MASAQARRWLPRVAAPVALLLAATIAILIVRSALQEADERSDPAPPPPATTTPPPPPATTITQASPEFYVVQSGDTLTAIADRFGTSVDVLLTLNPEIDPAALVVGQRLRVE